MDTIQTIERIEQDFSEQNAPFDDVTFPEQRLLEEVSEMRLDESELTSLSMEDKLRLISMFATFDYNRDANQLVDKLLTLQRERPEFFDPWQVNTAGELNYIFEDIGFRYPSRDAQAWAKNCRILRNNYHGEWCELVLDVGCDAVALVERLKMTSL